MKATIAQAAARLEVSENAVRCRIRRGTLKATRKGSRVFVLFDQGDQDPTNKATDLQAKVLELEQRLQEERRRADRLLEVVEREQTLRQQLQFHLDKLTETLALPAPRPLSPLVANLKRRFRDTG